MKKYFSKTKSITKLALGLSMLSFIFSCAHGLMPVAMSADSNPNNEIALQRSLMSQAYKDQVDVLAPNPFQKAETYLLKAAKINETGKSSADVLESIGYSKAYLNQATSDANQVGQKFNDVVDARSAAILVGAKNTESKEIFALDNKFRSLTQDIEDSREVKAEEKKLLQAKYLDLELACIKKNNLDEAKNILEQAKNKGAEKTTPIAYDEAKQKLNSAEKIIETDRHNAVQVREASKVATNSATRLMNLLTSAQMSKVQTPEQRARMLETRDQEAQLANLKASDANSRASDANFESQKKDQQLAQQGAKLEAVRGQNTALKAREEKDAIVANAEAQFKKSEAEVYRQDGNLIIRLKSMNFAPGRSDLPAASMLILNKVKNVIRDIGAVDVSVEGHTDAVGNVASNQLLSEKRAMAVSTFFSSDDILAKSKFESSGFGYSKPLATNKTKEGRAQNRRVDLVIKTIQN